MPDMVNHPPHYKAHPSGIECITVTEHFNFNMGNAIKYIWRADEKGDPVENLEKARWYIQREIERRGTSQTIQETTGGSVATGPRLPILGNPTAPMDY